MAEVPDVNPAKPIWPRRQGEQGPEKRRRREDDNDGGERDDSGGEDEQRPRQPGSGHIDEYV